MKNASKFLEFSKILFKCFQDKKIILCIQYGDIMPIEIEIELKYFFKIYLRTLSVNNLNESYKIETETLNFKNDTRGTNKF